MGIKERKERERLQRHGEILDAARRQFDKKGFLNTTLQDVASEAEISVGLIYRYFESKEDIFASLALEGAEQFDAEIVGILALKSGSPRDRSAADILAKLAQRFFDYYGPYGEYFDMLMYSYKGMKEVQIKGSTLTKLMSVTLQTLDQIKQFIQSSSEFSAKDDDEALQVVFLLWGMLLGCLKLFDSTGRGHLFAFAYNKDDFVRELIGLIFKGISGNKIELSELKKRNPITLAPEIDA